MTSKKFAAYIWSSLIGVVAFGLVAFKIPVSDLASVVQIFYLYQGLITAGFFGFRFGEQWAKAK